MNRSIFITPPKFQLGQGIIHRYEADLMKDGVVSAKDFGVIVGIVYCDENSVYVGWSYQVYLWKTVYEHDNRDDIDYYTDISYSSFDESEDVQLTEIIDCAKLVEKINKKQFKKYTQYTKTNYKDSKLYNLINNVLVKDTYYDDSIKINTQETVDIINTLNPSTE
jgi:hypothetical protein